VTDKQTDRQKYSMPNFTPSVQRTCRPAGRKPSKSVSG